MKMRMKRKGLSPCVQYGYYACLWAQPLVVFAKGVYHTPCCFKQQVVKHSRFMHAKLIERIRKGKNYMKVWYRQKFFLSCLYPFFALFTLTFRAMTVTAAIIADM